MHGAHLLLVCMHDHAYLDHERARPPIHTCAAGCCAWIAACMPPATIRKLSSLLLGEEERLLPQPPAANKHALAWDHSLRACSLVACCRQQANCYCYSLGQYVGSYCSPGFGATGEHLPTPIKDCGAAVAGLVLDGAQPVDRNTVYGADPGPDSHYIAMAVVRRAPAGAQG
jgi:hypothetical protein